MAEIGWLDRGLARARGFAEGVGDRHARRARDLAARLDARVGDGAGASSGGDDEAGVGEIELRPWELRLPRPVILAIARERGLVPVGGTGALVERGPWREPIRLHRESAGPRGAAIVRSGEQSA